MNRPPSRDLLTFRALPGLLPGALVLLFVGCAPAAAPVLQGSSRPIIGGVADPQDPAIVLLVGTARRTLSLCTAEVISPHVVLTAAHCVDPAVIGKGVTYQVFTGADYNDPAQYNNGANYIGVASTQFDPLFDVGNLQGGHDVGLVVTSQAIGIAPLPLNRAPLVNADNGSAFRLVGYGVNAGTDTGGVSAGTKRQTTSTLFSYDDLFLEFKDPKHLTCEGDSGGPALLTRNGVELIAGITSFGDQGCTQAGFETRVDSYLDLIDSVVAAAEGGGRAPDLGVVAAPDLAATGGGDGTGLVGGGGGGRQPTFDGGLSRPGDRKSVEVVWRLVPAETPPVSVPALTP